MSEFSQPVVSIIIPTHNRQALVLRALESVLLQSFDQFEVIVVDDGSTDNTLSYLQKISDARLRVLAMKHAGVAKARNEGAKIAKADWLCFLDSDDVWRRHKLSEQIRFHHQHSKILLSQTDDVWIRDGVFANKKKEHENREGDIFLESLKLCLICCSSVMVNKDLFFSVGGFDESLVTCEDYDLWLRLLLRTPVGFVNKKLVTKFGGHADQLSKAFDCMDLYRLKSLHKILQNEKLSAEQEKAVRTEIDIKTAILDKGAGKRGRTSILKGQ
ncbi:MAG: glycosyltransferase [Deltaproteobacteria bacterium]|nr:glycosyltransferase [Deltaproteobacteria bacterium]